MDHLRVEAVEGVLRIQLDRPEKKNALTAAMYAALTGALEQAGSDAGVRAVLLHGHPEAFTSGNDLSDFLERPPRGEDAPVFRFLLALAGLEKPLVAAVSGAVVGIGTTALLHCDLVYAAHGTRFSLPFVSLGLVPEAASTLLLPRLAGWQRAAELLMLGEPFGPEQALQLGLVNAIEPPERLMDTAMSAARKLAAKPPAALRATKALMKEALRGPVGDALRAEARVFVERLASPEVKEAFSAFMEKRKPNFSPSPEKP